MIQKVAIFGAGIVGNATKMIIGNFYGTQIPEFHFNDPQKGLNEVKFDEDIAFICVPTNQSEFSLGYDYSNIAEVMDLLREKNFKGDICIRSTIEPSAMYGMLTEYSQDLVFWPEFLREETWEYDAENPKIVVIGGSEKGKDRLCQYLTDINYAFTASWYETDAITAAIAKLSINSFLATKVALMNVIHDVAEKCGGDFNAITSIMLSDGRCGNTHFKVPGPDGQFGFGGKCFPKDLAAFAYESEVGFLAEILKYNEKKRYDNT